MDNKQKNELNVFVKYKTKLIKWGIFAVILLTVILAVFLKGYSNAGKFEDPKKLFNVNIPFTTKSFIAKWNGVIKAGVKIDEINVEINKTDK